MLDRQDSSFSASLRRDTATPSPESHRANSVGCIPGIFRYLLSKYHQNHNKRLTFAGKRQGKSSKPKSSPKANQKQSPGVNIRSSTCDIIKVPRSPTIPAELRRSNAATPPAKSPRTPPQPPPSSLVTRLMGLDDDVVAAKESQTAHKHQQEAVDDRRMMSNSKGRRQKLLEALEKCNHDLEALKRTITALKSAGGAGKSGCSGGGSTALVGPCMARITPTTGQAAKLQNYSTSRGLKSVLRQPPKPITLAKKLGEDEQAMDKLFNRPKLLLLAKNSSPSSLTRRTTPPAQTQCSTTMVQTVDEVCKDIANWGGKREAGRLGIVLQDLVCKDLVDELVEDLGGNSRYYKPLLLPHEACKRRLSF